jgi:cytochrome c oxidase subunit 4
MGHLSKEEGIKAVKKGLILLAVITLIEVLVSLFGKGHLGIDPSFSFELNLGLIEGNIAPLLIVVGLLLIGLSLYKAYYIVYMFMHMADEVKGLRMSVVLPMLLFVWAVIAFFQEGNSWKERRDLILEKNKIESKDMISQNAVKEEAVLKNSAEH